MIFRASAFDSPEQQEHVAELLEQYNETTDDGTGRSTPNLLRSRASEALSIPFAPIVKIPFLRSLALWFTPRVELLPLSGHLWPLREKWDDDAADFLTTLGFFLLNCVYVALAIAGAWIARKRPGWRCSSRLF